MGGGARRWRTLTFEPSWNDKCLGAWFLSINTGLRDCDFSSVNARRRVGVTGGLSSLLVLLDLRRGVNCQLELSFISLLAVFIRDSIVLVSHKLDFKWSNPRRDAEEERVREWNCVFWCVRFGDAGVLFGMALLTAWTKSPKDTTGSSSLTEKLSRDLSRLKDWQNRLKS